MPTDRFLARISESVGLVTTDIHLVRSKRVGSSIINSGVRVEPDKRTASLYEAVVELRKA